MKAIVSSLTLLAVAFSAPTAAWAQDAPSNSAPASPAGAESAPAPPLPTAPGSSIPALPSPGAPVAGSPAAPAPGSSTATPSAGAAPSSLGVATPSESIQFAPPPSVKARETPTAKGGPGDPASVAGGPGGFRIQSPKDDFEIRFRALVQADGRFWFDDSERPQTDTLLIRRAQIWTEGRLPYGVNFMLNPDFGGGTVVLQDAYLGLDVADALKFRFGKFRPPFGLERLRPTSNLMFVEFGIPTLLTPNRDVGAMVYGDAFNRFAGYAAGVFNGVPDNGSGDLDLDKEKEFVGRLYLRPFEPVPHHALGRMFVGVATTFGREYGTPGTPGVTTAASTPAYKTPGQINDFTYLSAASGVTPDYSNTVVANGPHNRYGAYLFEAIGPFSLMGEIYFSDQEVGRAGKGNTWIHNKAYQAQAGLILFGANAAYDYVHVDTPVDLRAGHFGAVELAFRAGHLSNDLRAFPNFASPTASVRGATNLTAGVNWYWSDNAKFVVNWDHTEFQGGAKTAAELAAQHREAENIILLRAQVVY